MKRIIYFSFFALVLQTLPAQHIGNFRHSQPIPAQPYGQNQTQPSTTFMPPTLDPNFFFVSVKVLTNHVPDAYLAIFNVMQLGENVEEANQLMQTRLDSIMMGLDKIGIPKSEVFIDMISQIPIYEYQAQKKVFSKSYQEIPAGIELQKNLHIRFKDGNLMEKVVRIMARQEVFELVKVDYLIEDQDKILQQARKRAIEFSREQLSTYEALGVKYDTLPILFNESRQVVFPLSQYKAYQSKASSSLKAKIKDESQVQQVRTPQVLYYQPIPQDDYSVVINPLAKEPCVQFHYELLLRYQLHLPQAQARVEQKTVREREYIILTPDGNTKRLELTRDED